MKELTEKDIENLKTYIEFEKLYYELLQKHLELQNKYMNLLQGMIAEKKEDEK